MSPLLIDSGIESAADLAGILPGDVRERITPEMLTDAPACAALRVLATIRNPRWRAYVHGEAHGPENWVRIDWTDLLADARWHQEPTDSVRVRLEIAASLAGHLGANPQLLYAARKLDAENLAAVLDGIRIAAEGWPS